MSAEK